MRFNQILSFWFLGCKVQRLQIKYIRRSLAPHHISLVVPDNQPPQPVIVHGTVSLQNIVADEDINKDAKFLDDINKVINDAETSQIFLPQMHKLREAYNDGRKSVRKRVEQKRK